MFCRIRGPGPENSVASDLHVVMYKDAYLGKIPFPVKFSKLYMHIWAIIIDKIYDFLFFYLMLDINYLSNGLKMNFFNTF